MSSSRSLSLLVLAGCNQLFGIKDTAPAPAVFYDGGVDAARGCAGPGVEPDSYSPYVHQVYVQDCRNYSSVPAGRAIATCFEGMSYVIHEGVAGQPLPPAGVTLSGSETISATSTPRLSPDGQRILMITQNLNGPNTVSMFVRQSDGSWLETPSGIPADPYYTGLSTIAHVATGDRMLLRGTTVTEWELHGATWDQVLVQQPAGNDWQVMSMTSDGLHLLISDYRQALYAARADVMQPFGTPVPLPGVPGVQDNFMTDDCSRVYMSGFGALYDVEQN